MEFYRSGAFNILLSFLRFVWTHFFRCFLWAEDARVFSCKSAHSITHETCAAAAAARSASPRQTRTFSPLAPQSERLISCLHTHLSSFSLRCRPQRPLPRRCGIRLFKSFVDQLGKYTLFLFLRSPEAHRDIFLKGFYQENSAAGIHKKVILQLCFSLKII